MQFDILAGEFDDFFFLESGFRVFRDDPVDLLHSFHGFADRDVVCEDTAHPAFRNVIHAGGFRAFTHDLLSLTLCSDKEDLTSVDHNTLQEIAGIGNLVNGFCEVDDGDSVFRTVNVLFHLGVPTFRLVTEMTSGLEQIFDRDCHD